MTKRKKIVEPLRKDIDPPKIYILPEAFLKIRQLVALCGEEVGWMGSVARDGDDYTIYDIHMFDQEVHGAETDIDAASIGKVAFGLMQQGKQKEVNEMRFWGHSHVNMGVSPSGQDVTQALEFGEPEGMDYFLCGIFNKKHDMRMDLYDYENQEVWEELPIHLGSPELIHQIRTDMGALIKEHVTNAKPIAQYGYLRSNPTITHDDFGYDDDYYWNQAYGHNNCGNRGYRQPPRLPAGKAGSTGTKPVGQGSGRSTQRGKSVVHPKQIGQNKAQALADNLLEINPMVKIQVNQEFLTSKSPKLTGIVIMLVDSMATRKELWIHHIKFNTKVPFMIEARMGTHHGQLFTINPMDMTDIDLWESNLYTDDDVKEETTACGTSQTMAPTATIMAGYMAWNFVQAVNGDGYRSNILLNLGEMPVIV